MSNQNQSTGLTKTGRVMGIIGLVFALLPLISGWFLMISWLGYVLGFIGLICSIIALVKKQKGAIIALVLSLTSLIAPFALAEVYVEKSLESTSNLLEKGLELTNSIDNLNEREN